MAVNDNMAIKINEAAFSSGMTNLSTAFQSISDKIKQMKEELKKNNINDCDKEYNNDFKLRLERITNRGKKINDENENKNNLLIKPKKDLNLNLMKNKLKFFENRREKEKCQKKNAFDELDDILNKFKNDRYGN